MTLYLKYDFNAVCRAVLKEQLDELGIPYSIVSNGEVQIQNKIDDVQYQTLADRLKKYGIDILDGHKSELVQRIKDAIHEMIEDENSKNLKISVYLADKLNYSYAYLSNLFSENTYTSIENYVILQKVDRAKELLLKSNLTLTEIAHRLNYSSVAHLSSQFKKTTGLAPSAFQQIVERRKKNRSNQLIEY